MSDAPALSEGEPRETPDLETLGISDYEEYPPLPDSPGLRTCTCAKRGLTAHELDCVIFTLPEAERVPFLFNQHLASDLKITSPTWPTETERELAIGALISAEDDDEIDREWARVRELFARCESLFRVQEREIQRLTKELKFASRSALLLDDQFKEVCNENERLAGELEAAEKHVEVLRATALTPEEWDAIDFQLSRTIGSPDLVEPFRDKLQGIRDKIRARALSGETPK